MMNEKGLGRHILVDYKGCDPLILNDLDRLKDLLLEGTRRSGARIVTDVFHRFNPHGISGVIVIAESHVAIHTWPEFQCASVDIFSCSDTMDPYLICDFLKHGFSAKESTIKELRRG